MSSSFLFSWNFGFRKVWCDCDLLLPFCVIQGSNASSFTRTNMYGCNQWFPRLVKNCFGGVSIYWRQHNTQFNFDSFFDTAFVSLTSSQQTFGGNSRRRRRRPCSHIQRERKREEFRIIKNEATPDEERKKERKTRKKE